ncbi:Elongation of fatty acids protein 2 [Brettanomyces nanus]|uniref:Flap endonuclease 1 n=1 Tax=Eeniella nana TaxID=13502 RepID=A0A875S158_EENNA|nr:Elongation of fatty acids protein 2 [Brettanomyces nanus]QPG74065.1 Elongation of fatty acids protein 2 [Brettanomyces nanus]
MGIRGLNALVSENAPKAIRSSELKSLFGRKVAIDASMCLYQFLIAVRQQDGSVLTNESGRTTSHLMGFFYRTIRMAGHGIKPCYVFDGKPPVMKGGELEKRLKRREDAEKKATEAKEAGQAAELMKYQRRTVRVTREQNEDAKKLLKLMGIPFVEAPCEAESQCAELAKAGKVYGAASEDMDTLCYQPPFLLRNLTAAEARKLKIDEYNIKEVLKGFDMPIEQFIDMCILLGCDYCETIRGVGPVTAMKMIRKYGSLEKIVETIENDPKSKYKVPENWPYKEARQLFLHPEVTPGSEVDLKWTEPDIDALINFMVKENGFNEQRIRDGAAKLSKALKSGTQERLDSFFRVSGTKSSNKKRTTKEEAKNGNKKKTRRRR